jgi:uncharacterized membrane protein (DUF485 family)
MRVHDRSRDWVTVLYVITLVVVIVFVDVVFFRHHFALRLIANVGIVLAFSALYLGFFRRR